MSTTKSINPANGNSGKGAKAATAAAGVAVGAAAGAAATYAATGNAGEDIAVNPEEPIINPEEPVVNPENPVHTPDQPVVTPQQPTPANPQNPANHPETPTHNPENPVNNPDNHGGTDTPAGENGEMDPDRVAEAIISGEQVDPDDINLVDIYNIDETGIIYDETGQAYNAAVFHDPAGNQMVMVDVDNDNVFDVVLDETGQMVAQVDDGITTSDVEMALTQQNTFMAQNDDNPADDIDPSVISQDIIA